MIAYVLLALLRLRCSQNWFGTVNDLNAVHCKNNELHFALIICRSICTSVERGKRDDALKITASDVLLIGLHFLIDKNRMTFHI
jgi:hypothetical protein